MGRDERTQRWRSKCWRMSVCFGWLELIVELNMIGFFNYFQYGLDFLISADGLVKKVIAHSNIVCLTTPVYISYDV